MNVSIQGFRSRARGRLIRLAAHQKFPRPHTTPEKTLYPIHIPFPARFGQFFTIIESFSVLCFLQGLSPDGKNPVKIIFNEYWEPHAPKRMNESSHDFDHIPPPFIYLYKGYHPKLIIFDNILLFYINLM
jgi:hypothetical protein